MTQFLKYLIVYLYINYKFYGIFIIILYMYIYNQDHNYNLVIYYNNSILDCI
jgi:hypothetical protein